LTDWQIVCGISLGIAKRGTGGRLNVVRKPFLSNSPNWRVTRNQRCGDYRCELSSTSSNCGTVLKASEIGKMKELRVRDIMTQEVTTLKRNDKLTLANDIMQLGRIRHLPVLEDDGERLVGIVSQRDLFRGALAHALGYGQHAQRKVLDTLLVKEVMSSDVRTTTPDMPLVEAARILVKQKIGCLPVIEDGHLVGIVTEGDFVAMVARKSP
jgi:CBS domain-containing membrane protein